MKSIVLKINDAVVRFELTVLVFSLLILSGCEIQGLPGKNDSLSGNGSVSIDYSVSINAGLIPADEMANERRTLGYNEQYILQGISGYIFNLFSDDIAMGSSVSVTRDMLVEKYASDINTSVSEYFMLPAVDHDSNYIYSDYVDADYLKGFLANSVFLTDDIIDHLYSGSNVIKNTADNTICFANNINSLPAYYACDCKHNENTFTCLICSYEPQFINDSDTTGYMVNKVVGAMEINFVYSSDTCCFIPYVINIDKFDSSDTVDSGVDLSMFQKALSDLVSIKYYDQIGGNVYRELYFSDIIINGVNPQIKSYAVCDFNYDGNNDVILYVDSYGIDDSLFDKGITKEAILMTYYNDCVCCAYVDKSSADYNDGYLFFTESGLLTWNEDSPMGHRICSSYIDIDSNGFSENVILYTDNDNGNQTVFYCNGNIVSEDEYWLNVIRNLSSKIRPSRS